jgi:flagellin
MRATNGAQSSRLQYALDSLNVNMNNLESANSRIYDVDVASETTRLARNNILVQSGAAMLAQANTSSQIALRLIQGQ